MKKFCIVTGLIGSLGLCYFLFQNIIEYNFGWEVLPTELFDYSFEGEADSTFLEQIQAAKVELQKIHKESRAPAVSIAISIDQKTVWTEALGLRDIQGKIPADTSTQFRIGSTSKALTSLGLGKLLQGKQIHLDSSIQFYTRHFGKKPKIKIKQLASHQSGIRNYSVCLCLPLWEYYRDKYFLSVEESLADFENDALLFQPGDEFSYSSYNFTALSHAMEEAASTDFLSLMDRQVFQPLNMGSTQPNFKHRTSANQTVFYDIRANEYKASMGVNLSNKWAGGGFLSTPSDLVKAGKSLLNDRFLKQETIQLLTEPQRLNNDSINGQKYALGWRHNKSSRFFDGEIEVDVIHHGGMAVGSQSLLMVFPEYDMVVSLLINRTGEQGRFQLFEYLTPIIEIFIAKLEMQK